MNALEKEIVELLHERTRALGELEVAYVHTKREMARKLSPSRVIRKHVGVSLGLAAVAGYLMAPAKNSNGVAKKAGAVMGWGKRLLSLVIPGLAAKAADKTAEEVAGAAASTDTPAPVAAPASPPPPPQRGVLHRGLVTALVAQGVSFLRHNKDIHKVLGDLVQNMRRGGSAPKKAAVVGVGDAGAIQGVEFKLTERE